MSLVTVKLEVEGMKHAIQAAISQRQIAVAEDVQNEIEKAVSEFDFVEEIRKGTRIAIAHSINKYFTYGEGSKIIDQIIEDTMNSFLRNLSGEKK